MKTRKRKNTTGSVLANLAGKGLLAAAAFALVGAGTVNAAYVTIGDAGNAGDTAVDGYGAVGYTYQISATEVSIAEFTASGAGSGNENYWNDGTRTVGNDAPAVNVSLYEAMKYANYLTSGDVTSGYYSSSDGGTTYAPDASSHDAYAAANGLTYFVPTENEWYKAAYGNAGTTEGDFSVYSDYANRANVGDTIGAPPPEGTTGTANDGWNYNVTANIGAQDVGFSPAEQNGTYDMMGNVWEWQEDTDGVLRGGAYQYSSADDLRSSHRNTWEDPTSEWEDIGFRVVAIPEPASGALLVLVGGMVWFVRRRARA